MLLDLYKCGMSIALEFTNFKIKINEIFRFFFE